MFVSLELQFGHWSCLRFFCWPVQNKVYLICHFFLSFCQSILSCFVPFVRIGFPHRSDGIFFYLNGKYKPFRNAKSQSFTKRIYYQYHRYPLALIFVSFRFLRCRKASVLIKQASGKICRKQKWTLSEMLHKINDAGIIFQNKLILRQPPYFQQMLLLRFVLSNNI